MVVVVVKTKPDKTILYTTEKSIIDGDAAVIEIVDVCK